MEREKLVSSPHNGSCYLIARSDNHVGLIWQLIRHMQHSLKLKALRYLLALWAHSLGGASSAE